MSETNSKAAIDHYLHALTEDNQALASAQELLRMADEQLISGPIATAAISTGDVVRYEPAQPDTLTENYDSTQLNESLLKSYLTPPLVPLQQRLDSSFTVLLLTIDGISVALPLVELGGIHKIEKINELPGKPSYSLGLLMKQSEKFHCVDTANLIMPAKYPKGHPTSANYRFAVQLDKSQFVLACESISDTQTITKECIKWRGHDNRQKWIAGTLKQQMCVLIDAYELIQRLTTNPSG